MQKKKASAIFKQQFQYTHMHTSRLKYILFQLAILLQ